MFFDIATGIFSTILVSKIFSIKLTFALVILGIIFNLLPDLDFIFHLIKGGKSGDAQHHRDLLHRPLLFIFTGILIYFVYSGMVGILFILTTILHHVHDSVGIGWGVQWFWPFNSDHFTFLYRYAKPGQILPAKLLYKWRHEEIDELAKNMVIKIG